LQNILHVPTLGDLAPIKQAREAIGLCMAMERHAGALFGNGARPAGVLKFKRKLTDDVYERLRSPGRQDTAGRMPARRQSLKTTATSPRSRSIRLTYSFRNCAASR